MTNSAGDGLTISTRRNKYLACPDAAGWHVGHKPSRRIETLCAVIVLRQLYNALANCFCAAMFDRKTHGPVAEIRLRHCVGFYHLVPDRCFEGAEVFGCGLEIGFTQGLRYRDHRRSTSSFAGTALHLFHLPNEVANG